jgi:hypothetical protein
VVVEDDKDILELITYNIAEDVVYLVAGEIIRHRGACGD